MQTLVKRHQDDIKLGPEKEVMSLFPSSRQAALYFQYIVNFPFMLERPLEKRNPWAFEHEASDQSQYLNDCAPTPPLTQQTVNW